MDKALVDFDFLQHMLQLPCSGYPWSPTSPSPANDLPQVYLSSGHHDVGTCIDPKLLCRSEVQVLPSEIRVGTMDTRCPTTRTEPNWYDQGTFADYDSVSDDASVHNDSLAVHLGDSDFAVPVSAAYSTMEQSSNHAPIPSGRKVSTSNTPSGGVYPESFPPNEIMTVQRREGSLSAQAPVQNHSLQANSQVPTPTWSENGFSPVWPSTTTTPADGQLQSTGAGFQPGIVDNSFHIASPCATPYGLGQSSLNGSQESLRAPDMFIFNPRVKLLMCYNMVTKSEHNVICQNITLQAIKAQIAPLPFMGFMLQVTNHPGMDKICWSFAGQPFVSDDRSIDELLFDLFTDEEWRELGIQLVVDTSENLFERRAQRKAMARGSTGDASKS